MKPVLLYHISPLSSLSRLIPHQPRNSFRPRGVYCSTWEHWANWAIELKKRGQELYLYKIEVDASCPCFFGRDNYSGQEYILSTVGCSFQILKQWKGQVSLDTFEGACPEFVLPSPVACSLVGKIEFCQVDKGSFGYWKNVLLKEV